MGWRDQMDFGVLGFRVYDLDWGLKILGFWA